MTSTDYIAIKDGLHDIQNDLYREQERLSEKAEELRNLQKVLDMTDEVISENDDLREEIERLNEQLQEKDERLAKMEMQLNEMSKMAASVAGKASQEELLKALRNFVNKSKRKKLEKRIAVKEMVLELAMANSLSFPEELSATIDSLDDEQPEAKGNQTFNNYGTYNEIQTGGTNITNNK